MVVASPCPLILAAPVAIVSGMSRASRSGIIVKTGSVLEKMAHPKTMAFDKTGTITSGQLTVDHLEPAKGIDIKELLHFAAGAEEQPQRVKPVGVGLVHGGPRGDAYAQRQDQCQSQHKRAHTVFYIAS